MFPRDDMRGEIRCAGVTAFICGNTWLLLAKRSPSFLWSPFEPHSHLTFPAVKQGTEPHAGRRFLYSELFCKQKHCADTPTGLEAALAPARRALTIMQKMLPTSKMFCASPLWQNSSLFRIYSSLFSWITFQEIANALSFPLWSFYWFCTHYI